MRITSHPLRGSAAATAVRHSRVFDPDARLHLRFVTVRDAPFVDAISPGPSLEARRRWIQHYKNLEAQGREFDFVIVENGVDRGLVRMHDFTEIGGEASFQWGDFLCAQPGLLTATALAIYSLGFETLGFARAHVVVPRTTPDMLAFHLRTGAELESDDGDYRYFRFGADAYDRVRTEFMHRRVVALPERA